MCSSFKCFYVEKNSSRLIDIFYFLLIFLSRHWTNTLKNRNFLNLIANLKKFRTFIPHIVRNDHKKFQFDRSIFSIFFSFLNLLKKLSFPENE